MKYVNYISVKLYTHTHTHTHEICDPGLPRSEGQSTFIMPRTEHARFLFCSGER